LIWGSNGDGTTTLYADGSSQIITELQNSGTHDIYNYSNPLSIGGLAAFSQYLQGTIVAIIGYRKVLTAAERAAIENYLNKKYDLY
jgi:hypothetical protein